LEAGIRLSNCVEIEVDLSLRLTGTPTKAFVYVDVPELTYEV